VQQSAVEALSPKKLAKLEAFILKRDNESWDEQMNKHAASVVSEKYSLLRAPGCRKYNRVRIDLHCRISGVVRQ